ncbi:hypothetical protein PPNSA23_46970 [Phyllobacterium phragmitis]|uniref:Cohesin domain-containing protein n=1 Tax=Phyllobacterium phragmitis TaxID=2670329 RepID=A0ABQ0H756_9HYPH
MGGIKIGDGLQAASDGTLSAVDRFSVYFNDLIYGIDASWIATTTCSISAGTNQGVAILETGPSANIEMDIYYLDNQTSYDGGDPPSVGTVSFQASSTVGTILFSKEVSLQAGNILGLQPPSPADQTAKGLRLVILASKTS